MLMDDASFLKRLGHVVRSVTGEAECERQEFMQRAVIYLWHEEEIRPGQRPAWYLRRCWFFLQHEHRHDHRMEPVKHASVNLRRPIGSNPGRDAEDSEVELAGADLALSHVCARDLIAVLANRLHGVARLVWLDLADGLTVTDIAQRRELSHQAISKHRKSIAALALDLGILPLASRL